MIEPKATVIMDEWDEVHGETFLTYNSSPNLLKFLEIVSKQTDSVRSFVQSSSVRSMRVNENEIVVAVKNYNLKVFQRNFIKFQSRIKNKDDFAKRAVKDIFNKLGS